MTISALVFGYCTLLPQSVFAQRSVKLSITSSEPTTVAALDSSPRVRVTTGSAASARAAKPSTKPRSVADDNLDMLPRPPLALDGRNVAVSVPSAAKASSTQRQMRSAELAQDGTATLQLHIERAGQTAFGTVSKSLLEMQELFQSALATHPTLQAGRLNSRAAAQEALAVRRGRWPTISTVLEAGSSNGSASRVLRVEQTLWDAGRLSSKTKEADISTNISLTQVYVQQFELFVQVINAYQALQSALERMQVAEKTLRRLKLYEQQMERRVAAQASPKIDLELSTARTLQTEVEYTTARTSLNTAITKMEQLTGISGLANRVKDIPALVSVDEAYAFANMLKQVDWAVAAGTHPAVQKTRLERQLVVQRLETKQAEAWPQIYARYDKPFPASDSRASSKPSVVAGLRYAPGAGMGNMVEAQAIATRIESQDQAIEAAQREVSQAIEADRQEFINALARTESLERSVASSETVLESSRRLFEAGRKSWPDLLNSVREVSSNESSLADARSALQGAMTRLELRMGNGLLIN